MFGLLGLACNSTFDNINEFPFVLEGRSWIWRFFLSVCFPLMSLSFCLHITFPCAREWLMSSKIPIHSYGKDFRIRLGACEGHYLSWFSSFVPHAQLFSCSNAMDPKFHLKVWGHNPALNTVCCCIFSSCIPSA